MNHYVRGQSTRPTGPQFEYFRDWVPYDTDPATAGKAIAAAYAQSSTVSWEPTNTLYFTGNDGLTATKARRSGRVRVVRQRLGRRPTSYSETSGLEGDTSTTSRATLPAPSPRSPRPLLKAPAEVVGAPVVTLHLSAPVGRADPGGRSRRDSWSCSPRCTTWRRTARRC